MRLHFIYRGLGHLAEQWHVTLDVAIAIPWLG